MTFLYVLFGLQSAALIAAAVWAGVRIGALNARLARMERRLSGAARARLARAPSRTRAEPALAGAMTDSDAGAPPRAFTARRGYSAAFSDAEARLPWPAAPQGRRPHAETGLLPLDAPQSLPPPAPALAVPPDLWRALALSAGLSAPALAAAFAAPVWAVIALAALAVAGVFALSLHPSWRMGAWFALAAAVLYAVAALGAGAILAAPLWFSAAAGLVAVSGLVQARADADLRPGLIAAGLASAALFALGAGTGLAAPPGLALGAVIIIAAALGAGPQRLEGLHLAAFAAAGSALFVLSGQRASEIWFTPAAAMAGAVFAAIALVRAPVLGPRGAVLGATGVSAALFAVSVMRAARSGLEAPWAAAGACLALAGLFALAYAAALKRAHGRRALGVTVWTLGLAPTACLIAAVLAGLPAPFQALAPALFAAMALAHVELDARAPAPHWRVAALACLAFAAVSAMAATADLGAGAVRLSAPLVIGCAAILPGALCGLAARALAQRAPYSSAAFETGTVLAATATLSLTVRYALHGEMLARAPLGFGEVGLHAGTWLVLALGVALWGEPRRLAPAAAAIAAWRRALAAAVTLAALSACAMAALLVPYAPAYAPLAGATLPVIITPALGFLLPGLVAVAHWTLWRRHRRPRHWRVHAARIAAIALLTAALIAEMLRLAPAADAWALGLVSLLALTGAGALALAPLRRPA